MFSVIGASFWKFVAIQQAIGMRLSFAKFLMDLCGTKVRAPAGATSSPQLRNSSQDNRTHCLISTQRRTWRRSGRR